MHISRITGRGYITALSIASLFITRFYLLGADLVHRDAYYFKNLSYIFMQELEQGHFSKLVLTIQPGVFTIYFNIIGFKLLYLLRNKLHLIDFNNYNFDLYLHVFQKIPQEILIVAFSLFCFYLINKLFGYWTSIIFLLIYSLEPLIIFHSRVIQTDGLQSVLMLASVLSLVYFLQTDRAKYLPAAGIIGGMAFLEKSPSILLLAIWGIILLTYELPIHEYKKAICRTFQRWGILFGLFIATAFSVFPAFWVMPIVTFKRLVIDTFLFGVQGINTENYTYDKYVTSSPYSLTYLEYLLGRHTEILVVGLLLLVVLFLAGSNFRRIILSRKNLALLIMVVVYFIMLQLSDKKFDRYLIIVVLPLIIFVAQAYSYLISKIPGKLECLFVMMIIITGFATYFYYMPDVGGYNNWFAKAVGYQRIEGGTGMYRLAKYIESKYGVRRKVMIGDYTSLKPFYYGDVVDYNSVEIKPDMLVIRKSDSPHVPELNSFMQDGDFTDISGTTYFIYQYDSVGVNDN